MISSILFTATTAFAAGKALVCDDPEKAFNPDFTLEIMHLQDITKGNEWHAKDVANTYTYIIEDLVATFPGKVKFGYAEFSDDASPDGDAKYANYQCMNIKRPLSVISRGYDVFDLASSISFVEDYDMYNCGFKARTLASNTGTGNIANWSPNDDNHYKILTTATNAPGKMAKERLGCPTGTNEYMGCEDISAGATFDETKNGDYMNVPTEEDMLRLGRPNRINMAVIDLVVPGDKKTQQGLTANDWWAVYGIDAMGQAWNTTVLDDLTIAGGLREIIYQNVKEFACYDKGQMGWDVPPAELRGQGVNGRR